MGGETTYLLDTCVIVACGDVDSTAYEGLRQVARRHDRPFEIPPRVYEELTAGPDAAAYTSATTATERAIEDGWLSVTEPPDYTNGTVSAVIDESRRFVAEAAGRPHDEVEKADTALVGVAADRLDTGAASRVEVYTGDKPAGRAAESLLPNHGFDAAQVEWIDGTRFVRRLRSDDI